MLITEDRVRSAARRQTTRLFKSADTVLAEALKATVNEFDVFLCHSTKDAEIVLGTKAILEDDYNFTVYVDWIVDSELREAKITPVNADKLRQRMRCSKMLLYIKTDNSPDSKWMPWELGFFDALGRPIGILPIVKSARTNYDGAEYLGLYPYVDEAQIKNSTERTLFINKSATDYDLLKNAFRKRS